VNVLNPWLEYKTLWIWVLELPMEVQSEELSAAPAISVSKPPSARIVPQLEL
jgi:hypothetical protein